MELTLGFIYTWIFKSDKNVCIKRALKITLGNSPLCFVNTNKMYPYKASNEGKA